MFIKPYKFLLEKRDNVSKVYLPSVVICQISLAFVFLKVFLPTCKSRESSDVSVYHF